MREFWFGFIGSVIGVLGALALIIIGGAFVISGLIASTLQDTEFASADPLPDEGIILEIDLRSKIDSETGSSVLDIQPPRVASFGGGMIEYTLIQAASDPRVDGAIVTTGATSELSTARAESIAHAVQTFAASGKVIHTHLGATYGGHRPDILLATASESASTSPFDTVSLELGLFSGTPEARSTASVLAFAQAVSRNPDVNAQALAESVERGFVTLEDALEIGLFDEVSSYYAAREALTVPQGRVAISHERYVSSLGVSPSRPHIAWLRYPTGNADSYIELLNTLPLIADEPQVDAIIVEVGPGTTYASFDSDLALAIQRARRAGKPVIGLISGSLHDTPYRNIIAADRIVMPATAVLRGIGESQSQLPPAFLQQGAAQAPSGEARLVMLEYARLIEDIAEARDLPMARVDELGRGQPWTGAQAVEFGLADEIGGAAQAVEAARQLAGIPSDADVELVIYPRPPSRSERLAQRLGELLYGAP